MTLPKYSKFYRIYHAAVGSRTLERAEWFARRHGIPTAHDTYEELCNDPNVDIVYVASLHPNHKDHAVLALSSGKHVLVEKPMAMRAEDAQLLYDLGKEKRLFVEEGMWTRFFPAVEWTRSHLQREEVHVVVGSGTQDQNWPSKSDSS